MKTGSTKQVRQLGTAASLIGESRSTSRNNSVKDSRRTIEGRRRFGLIALLEWIIGHGVKYHKALSQSKRTDYQRP